MTDNMEIHEESLSGDLEDQSENAEEMPGHSQEVSQLRIKTISEINDRKTISENENMAGENTSTEIDANLKLLGVNVQNQDELEANIMKKIDESIKEKERVATVKQVKKELLPIIDRLRGLLKTRRKCEKELKFLSNSSSTINSQQHRKIASLIADQQELSKLIYKNYTNQKGLLQN